MVPRMQILKNDKEITLMGDFNEQEMGLKEVKEYFENWLESYPQEGIENTKLFYKSYDGDKKEFTLH